MATIDFRSWRLQSDADCWILGKPKTRLNKKKERELFIEHPSYHHTLQAALQALLERELRQSDAKTAAEVLAELRSLRQEISELVPA
jgi:glutamate synthase domain-containing protein 3